LDNFCTVFVSFVLRLNRKIHVLKVLKAASKCTQTYYFADEK